MEEDMYGDNYMAHFGTDSMRWGNSKSARVTREEDRKRALSAAVRMNKYRLASVKTV